MNRWQRWNETLGRVEKILVAAMLSVMILLAFLQIVLRNVFSTGISWGDPLVRYLVLWVGFIGASLATKEGKHITIEIFSRWFSGQRSLYLKAISYLVSAFVCGLLTFAGWTFVQNEAQMGTTTFLKTPAWRKITKSLCHQLSIHCFPAGRFWKQLETTSSSWTIFSKTASMNRSIKSAIIKRR